MLHLAAAWCAHRRRPLTVFTVDHGLNPDSAAWTRFAGDAACAIGADWRALVWTGPKPAAGLPAAARGARHRLLAEAARAAGARVLLLGHTADDIAEADAMRLADIPSLPRLRDWSPSPSWPEGRRVFLLRPLLGVGRAELRTWLTERALAWLDDPANDDPRYARARARLRGPQAEPWANEAPAPRDPAVAAEPFGLLTIPRDVDARTLSAVLLCASGGTAPPRGEPLRRLAARLACGERFAATLAGARVQAQASVQVGRDPGRSGLPSLPVQAGEAVVWDGRFEVAPDAPGVIVPLLGRLSRLSDQARAELAAVPAWVRGTLPALETPDGAVRLVPIRALGPERLAAALGRIQRESDI